MAPRLTAAQTTGALLLAAVLVLAGCNGKKAPAPEPTAPVMGGALRVAVRDLSNLDPAKARGRGAIFVLAQIFRPLTVIDETGAPKPGAAASWRASADGLTYDFTIASGTHHDGSVVRAKDFKFAFDRITQKPMNSDTAFQFELVAGFRESKVAGTAKNLSGVKAVNDSTLRVRLERPFAELPRFLAHPALGPVSQSVLQRAGEGYRSQPIGNGPFRVAAARTERRVSLERYGGYGGRKPWVDRVEVEVRSDLGTVWDDLRAGKLDVGEVPPARIDAARKQFGESGFSAFWAASYYGFNLKNKKYTKLEVRRAISLAIDRAKLVTEVYAQTKRPATGIVPAGVPGSRVLPCDACGFDLPRARQLLSSVFKGKPPDFTIDHLDASPSREVARAVATMLGEAGLRASVRAHAPAAYLKLLREGRHDITELGWLSDVPSPDPFLAQLLRTGSSNNHTGFADKGFDAEIDAARKASAGPARIAAYRKAETRALAALPLVPLVFFESHIVARKALRGFRLNGGGVFDASAVWIVPARRSR